MKTDEAAILRQKMLRVYNDLSLAIEKLDMDSIRKAISDNSAFAGMLRWYLKNDFPDLFQQVMP